MDKSKDALLRIQEGIDDLICDDSTTTVTIKTPKNWKCKRKGCEMTVKHKHTTFGAMLDKPIKTGKIGKLTHINGYPTKKS